MDEVPLARKRGNLCRLAHGHHTGATGIAPAARGRRGGVQSVATSSNSYSSSNHPDTSATKALRLMLLWASLLTMATAVAIVLNVPPPRVVTMVLRTRLLFHGFALDT